MSYDLRPLDTPVLRGLPLRLTARLTEGALLGPLLRSFSMKQIGLDEFRASPIDAAPILRPPLPTRGALDDAPAEAPPGLEALAGPDPQGVFETAGDLFAAYRDGREDPEAVARRVIAAIEAEEAADPPLKALIAWDPNDILGQARASAARWKAGRMLGPLDGVPIAIKDEVDMVPFPTTVGTSFLGRSPARDDAETVARLRAAGAVLIGKANMHEIGLGVTGLNLHHGTPRNPYDRGCATGGSSSGSAAAVAAGLCPIALGADGGGSIRLPAALCGLVGLKPTFGRVSERGAAPLCWSVAHLGPIAATVRDAALAYAVLAGPDPRDRASLGQPAPRLPDFSKTSVKGLKVGVYRAWFEDASRPIVEACDAALARLVEGGAELVAIEVPALDRMRSVQFVTIAAEMACARDLDDAAHRGDYGPDVRLNLALARALTARDYIKAQRWRAWLCEAFAKLFEDVEVIATPSAGITAPRYSPAALRSGESNLGVLDRIMRFAPAANVTGLPGITVPVGYDPGGLPIGLHFLGRPWQEHRLLELAAVVEARAARKAPPRRARLLSAPAAAERTDP